MLRNYFQEYPASALARGRFAVFLHVNADCVKEWCWDIARPNKGHVVKSILIECVCRQPLCGSQPRLGKANGYKFSMTFYPERIAFHIVQADLSSELIISKDAPFSNLLINAKILLSSFPTRQTMRINRPAPSKSWSVRACDSSDRGRQSACPYIVEIPTHFRSVSTVRVATKSSTRLLIFCSVMSMRYQDMRRTITPQKIVKMIAVLTGVIFSFKSKMPRTTVERAEVSRSE